MVFYTDYYHKNRMLKDYLSNELDDVNEDYLGD